MEGVSRGKAGSIGNTGPLAWSAVSPQQLLDQSLGSLR